jgi:hypothetical protein
MVVAVGMAILGQGRGDKDDDVKEKEIVKRRRRHKKIKYRCERWTL